MLRLSFFFSFLNFSQHWIDFFVSSANLLKFFLITISFHHAISHMTLGYFPIPSILENILFILLKYFLLSFPIHNSMLMMLQLAATSYGILVNCLHNFNPPLNKWRTLNSQAISIFFSTNNFIFLKYFILWPYLR